MTHTLAKKAAVESGTPDVGETRYSRSSATSSSGPSLVQRPRSSILSQSSSKTRSASKLIERSCDNEEVKEKALELYESLKSLDSFRDKTCLPMVCTYISSQALGTLDIEWDAARIAGNANEQQMEDVWCAVRAHLTPSEPTVSLKSLIVIYQPFCDDVARVNALELMETICTHCRHVETLPSGFTPDMLVFSVYYWTCKLLSRKVGSKVCVCTDLDLLVDDYDIEKPVFFQAIAFLDRKYHDVAQAEFAGNWSSLVSRTVDRDLVPRSKHPAVRQSASGGSSQQDSRQKSKDVPKPAVVEDPGSSISHPSSPTSAPIAPDVLPRAKRYVPIEEAPAKRQRIFTPVTAPPNKPSLPLPRSSTFTSSGEPSSSQGKAPMSVATSSTSQPVHPTSSWARSAPSISSMVVRSGVSPPGLRSDQHCKDEKVSKRPLKPVPPSPSRRSLGALSHPASEIQFMEQLSYQIDMTTATIIEHVGTHGCQELKLKYKVIDLQILRREMDRLANDPEPATREEQDADAEALNQIRQAVREAEEELVAYVAELDANGKNREVDWKLRTGVLQLQVRLQDWRRAVGTTAVGQDT